MPRPPLPWPDYFFFLLRMPRTGTKESIGFAPVTGMKPGSRSFFQLSTINYQLAATMLDGGN
jgi:hypothetical protein